MHSSCSCTIKLKNGIRFKNGKGGEGPGNVRLEPLAENSLFLTKGK